MREFWRAAGLHLLERDGEGRLLVTDDFLRAYFLRPEVQPVAESCAAEHALHQALLEDPRRPVSAAQIAQLADPDARENYEVVLDFRDRLLAADTLERCYLSFFEEARVPVPPLFLDQLAQVILRNILAEVEDPMRLRAAELLFRAQKVSFPEGAVMLADMETVDMYATTGGFGGLGQLLAESRTPMKRVDLDVLSEANAALYWQREERHDTALNISFGQPGLDALCRVLEAWVAHFLGVRTSIQPVQQIRDEHWVWHIGLDREGSAILNDLYAGTEVDEERLGRILSLFRLEIDDPTLVLPEVAGRPIYLAMATGPDNVLRLKPQNLLVNLPLAPLT